MENLSAAMAVQNLLLMASALGLGTCVLTAPLIARRALEAKGLPPEKARILSQARMYGIKAEEIQVDLDGRSIRLSRDASAKKSREETLDDGRGYMRSYSYSSGRSSRRIPLPQDADGGAMRREDSAEKVRVIIPRRQG